MRLFLLLALLGLVLFSRPARAQEGAADSTAYASPGAVVDAYFAVVSGPAGPRRWDHFRALHLPGAPFHAVGIDEAGRSAFYPQRAEEYAAHLGEYVRTQGFYQRELSRAVTRYARMAHVLSAYASRNAPGGPVIDRGLISFQLVFDRGRWWIASALWNSETPEHPLPPAYLGAQ